MTFLETDTLGQERFSLLLLEPGEIYFEDFSVYFYPDGSVVNISPAAFKKEQQGHLKVCSKSVVFVPKDIQWPILKFPMQNVKLIEEHNVGLLSRVDKVLKITSDQCVEMKKNNIVAPYVFRKSLADYLFRLNYASLDDALGPICQIHRASTLPPADQAAMIGAIVLSRRSRVKFNTSWLEDLYENILLETQADRITPLATNPGRIMLTSSRLYFQPFNNIDRWPVLKIRVKDIKQIILRRFLLRQLGIEIDCCDTSPITHLYLAMKSEEDRNEFYDKITHLEDLQLEEWRQEDMTLRWQSGITSNYDYLLYLNSMADRSFNDLTQYPVMPWVVQDYCSLELDLVSDETFRDLSKPIGALNEERLQKIKERLPDLPEPKFLYGSHYSNPGYVLFFLARIAPEYVLCLQNGRFDHPDRMFNSLEDTWTNCLTGASDFKELIPEFYSGSGEFLVHNRMINFGFRNDGRPVGDVTLPPWASDPKDFVNKLRQALESDYVSRHLHHWIDLVFGYKQRGKEAMNADNVFHYLTYEGTVDLQRIKEPNERACLETQIMEFGQTPKQLFKSPHPQRLTSSPSACTLICPSLSVNSKPEVPAVDKTHLEGGDAQLLVQSCQTLDSGDERTDKEEGTALSLKNFDSLALQLEYTLHKNIVAGVQMSADEKNIFSVSHDGLLKMYSLEEQRQLRSVNISSMPLSSCVVMPDNKTIVIGSWDNNIYFYSIEYGSMQETLQAHDDAVSCLMWKDKVLYTASWDGTVKMWQLEDEQGSVTHTEYLGQLDHEDGVLCMDTHPSCQRMATGSRDGHLGLWDLDHCYLINSISVHDGPVNACYMCPESRRLVTFGADRLLKVTDMDTMTEMFTKDLTHPVLCVGTQGPLVVTGDAAGRLQAWDMGVGQVVGQLEAHKEDDRRIQQLTPEDTFFVLAHLGTAQSVKEAGNTGGVTSINTNTKGDVLSGGDDRCVRLWKPVP